MGSEKMITFSDPKIFYRLSKAVNSDFFIQGKNQGLLRVV